MKPHTGRCQTGKLGVHILNLQRAAHKPAHHGAVLGRGIARNRFNDQADAHIEPEGSVLMVPHQGEPKHIPVERPGGGQIVDEYAQRVEFHG